MATNYYLFPENLLVKVINRLFASAYRDGKGWWRTDGFALKVTGIDGTYDFEDLTTDEAKRRFPRAFPASD